MKICVIGDAPIGTRATQALAHAGVERVSAVAAPEGQVANHSSFSAEVYLMALATSQQVQKGRARPAAQGAARQYRDRSMQW
ncbi:hypothetical protein KDX00_18130 [Cobetia amphilecti]|nr:hypothetical protein KDX00_18130 [Cobetia litoralis]